MKNGISKHFGLIIVVICLVAVGFGGCTKQPVQEGEEEIVSENGQVDGEDLGGTIPSDEVVPVEPETEPYVTFEVPEGWEFRNEQAIGGPVGATWDTGATNVWIDRVNLQLSPSNIYIGDEKEAERIAKRAYEVNYLCSSPPCESVNGWPPPEFKKILLPNGISIYAGIHASSIDKQWYSRDEDSPYSWGSVFTFSKDGYTFKFLFSDRPDLYIEEFDLITRTLKAERR